MHFHLHKILVLVNILEFSLEISYSSLSEIIIFTALSPYDLTKVKNVM